MTKNRVVFLLVLVCILVLVAGAGQASKYTIVGRKPPQEKVEEIQPPPPVTEEKKVGQIHVVVAGECLFTIASYREYYGDPYKWPLIYEANKDKIANPNWIYPGQELYIPPE
jgi:nucleoid-associated protein YgaU